MFQDQMKYGAKGMTTKMKNYLHSVSISVLLVTATVLALGSAGCTGDRYQRSTGEYIDDKTIGSKVKAALFGDKEVSGFAVNVDTYRGVVQLSGFVDTAEQKNRAGEVARAVQGVREVRNNLVVK
jgi:hyperosmotically inducible protein